MSVYRGGKPKDKNPAKSPKPQPRPTPQPQVRQPDSELIGLNDHRQRHGHDPLDDPEAIDDGPEVDDQVADSGSPPPPSGGLYDQGGFYDDDPEEGGRRGVGQGATKFAKSAAGKKVALAASGLLAPALIAVILLVLAMEAGLQTQQVARAIVGVRFSRLYGQMNKRLAHVSNTYTIFEAGPDDKINDIYNRRSGKQGLFRRLLGVSSDQVHTDLSKKGYKFEKEPRGVRAAVRGYQRVTRVLKPDGTVALDTKNGNIGRQLNELKAEFRDNGYSRLQARRAVRHVAYQGGIRLSRFRTAMDTIRNKIRGPPRAAVADTAVSNDIITDKARVRHKIFRVGGVGAKGLFHVPEGDIVDAGGGWAGKDKKWIGERGRRIQNFRDNVTTKLGGTARLAKAARWVRKGSLVLLTTTLFCTAFEIVSMITQLARLKILQQMDTAVSVLTTASQMKTGNIEYEISNSLNSRFDGFGNSVTYQVLHDGVNSQNKSQVEATIKYINQHFNIKKSFGSVFKILHTFTSKFLEWFKAALRKTIYEIKLAHDILSQIPILSDLLNKIVGFLSGGRADFDDLDPETIINNLVAQIPAACSVWLDPVFQIVTGVVLGLVELIITFFSGGAWAALRVAAHALVQTVLLAFVVHQVAEHTQIDEALTASLMPEAVAVAAGVSSALSDEPGQGVENYLRADYGAWHTSTAQALSEGGHLINRGAAVAQDKFYIAQYRQGYAEEGVWSNIANPLNPFSTIAKLQSWLPANPAETQPDQVRTTTSWIASTPLVWLGSAQADELTNAELAELLYPNQGRDVSIAANNAIPSQPRGGFEVTNPENYYSITEIDGHKEAGTSSSDNYFETIEAVRLRAGVIGFEEYEVNGENEFDFESNTEYVEQQIYDDNKLGEWREMYGQCLASGIDGFRLWQAGITNNGAEFYDSETCGSEKARRYMIYYQDCNHISTLERINTNSSPMLATDCDHLLPAVTERGLQDTDPSPNTSVRYRSFISPDFLTAGSLPTPGLTVVEPIVEENSPPNETGWGLGGLAQSLATPWEARRWRLS